MGIIINKHSKFVYMFTKHPMVLIKFLNSITNKTKVKNLCIGKDQNNQ